MSNSSLRKTYTGSKNNRGPIVGVLCTRKKKDKYYLPVGRESRIYEEMSRAARQKGIIMYFFYPDAIRWGKRKVKGHMFSDNRWQIYDFPVPSIIYNRIVHRKVESQKKVKQVLDKIQQDPEIYMFNTRFLDKWEVHECLHNDVRTRHLLPDTRIFSLINLSDFLSNYKEVFIKPRNSNTGKGIIKIVSDSEKEKYCWASGKDPLQWYKCSSITELYNNIKKLIKNNDGMLIQEGINLATYNQRIFDLRAQVQKNGNGEWVFTGMGVRIAAKNHFLTHVPNGGRVADFLKISNKVFIENLEKVNKLNEQLAYIFTNVPQVVENKLDISLGVLSMDIGIDRQGTAWIIELNSKPASFDEKAIRNKHLKNLMDYLLFVDKKISFKEGI